MTPDSSSLDLRQRGEFWTSSVWVLHSSSPCTLPSQHSQDSRQCCFSVGVRNRPAVLRLIVQKAEFKSLIPHWWLSPTDPQKWRKMDKGTIQYLPTQKADAGLASANKSLKLSRVTMRMADGAETDGTNSSFPSVVSGYKWGERRSREWGNALRQEKLASFWIQWWKDWPKKLSWKICFKHIYLSLPSGASVAADNLAAFGVASRLRSHGSFLVKMSTFLQ